MAKIYKTTEGDTIISMSKDENSKFLNGLRTAVEELTHIKNEEAMTDTDKDFAETALNGLAILHDYCNPTLTIADIANCYSKPAVYHTGTKEYNELSEMPQPIWEKFLDELAKNGLTCNYNTQHDCFTVG